MHHHPNQHNAIRSILEDILQTELNSLICQGKQTPDETSSTPRSNALPDILDPSTPRSHAFPNVLDECEPQNSIVQHDKDRNEPISRRRSTRRALSPIIVPRTAMPPPLPQAREPAWVRRVSKNLQIDPTYSNSHTAIERILPTCTTDHPPAEAHRSKRRRLGSDAVAAPPRKPMVHTTPTPNPTGDSVYPCLQVPDEGGNGHAVGVVPPDIVSKINRVGSVKVLEELRGDLFRLRAGARQKPLTPNYETRVLCVRDSLKTHRSDEVARALSNIRDELEVAEIGEQLYRFRKRVALSYFYDFYEIAQENPSHFLSRDYLARRDTKRSLAYNIIRRQTPRIASLVLNRIVDMIFSDTVLKYEDVATASKEAQRTVTKRYRKAAV